MEDAKGILGGLPPAAERLLGDEFNWSYLYELPFPVILVLNFTVSGHLHELLAAAKAAEPEEAILDMMEREMKDDTPLDWNGGTGGVFTVEDAFAVVTALFRSFQCLTLYGVYMSDLVEQIRGGSEEAFFHA